MSAKKYLVVRLGAMGDVLHAMPAVAALRHADPEAQIHWVVDPRWLPLLAATADAAPRSDAMPLVDKFHLADTRAWTQKPFSPVTLESVLDLRRELREHNFDAALDFQGSIRSAVIGRFAQTQRLVGSDDPRERPARWLYSERVQTHMSHVVDQALEVASVGCNTSLNAANTLLPLDMDAEQWCAQMLAQDSSGHLDLAVVTAGAGWGAKRWPAERYGEVAAGLADAGLAVYVNCGPGEEEMARKVVESSGKRARVLSASLPHLMAMLRRARIFIGGDTGPLHLAAALRVPVIGLYGPTDPERNGPYGTQSIVLRHAISRRDHTRHAATEAGLMEISARAVLDAARNLLQQSKSGLQTAGMHGMTLVSEF